MNHDNRQLIIAWRVLFDTWHKNERSKNAKKVVYIPLDMTQFSWKETIFWMNHDNSWKSFEEFSLQHGIKMNGVNMKKKKSLPSFRPAFIQLKRNYLLDEPWQYRQLKIDWRVLFDTWHKNERSRNAKKNVYIPLESLNTVENKLSLG